MEPTQEHNSMCITRVEVERVIDKSTEELRNLIKDMERVQEKELDEMKKSYEVRMDEVASKKVTEAKDGLLRYVGFGGIVSIVVFVYFIGGLINKVENLQGDVATLSDTIGADTSARFTIDDGNKLKQYTDQQDQYIQKQVDSLQASVDKGFDEVKDILKSNQK
jgi:hypothetical protein